MIKFDRQSADNVEIWKSDPVTEHLVAELKREHKEQLKALEIGAAGGNAHEALTAMGGRCSELRKLIDAIAEAKGSETDG